MWTSGLWRRLEVVSQLSFLLLVDCTFSPSFFSGLVWLEVCQFYWCPQRTSFCIIFFPYHLFSISLIAVIFIISFLLLQFSSVQSLSRVRLFATPWIAACQASLSITNSRISLRLTSIFFCLLGFNLLFLLVSKRRSWGDWFEGFVLFW